MSGQLKLMCVLAHPDDESLGVGGTLAKYSSEGVATYLITATRGERGRFGSANQSPGSETVGKTREGELLAAAEELGLREVQFLDYRDAELDRVDPREASGKIAAQVRRIRPQVVITFGPEGAYGHPDHIAISQLTTAAIVCAADPDFQVPGGISHTPPHCVSKLYYMAWPKNKWDAYQAALKTLKSSVDGVERLVNPWPDWAVTTIIDTSAFAQTVWRAVSCHKTQIATYKKLEHMAEEHHQALWGSQEFYRVFSLVNGGRKREIDLFEGLRVSDGRET